MGSDKISHGKTTPGKRIRVDDFLLIDCFVACVFSRIEISIIVPVIYISVINADLIKMRLNRNDLFANHRYTCGINSDNHGLLFWRTLSG